MHGPTTPVQAQRVFCYSVGKDLPGTGRYHLSAELRHHALDLSSHVSGRAQDTDTLDGPLASLINEVRVVCLLCVVSCRPRGGHKRQCTHCTTLSPKHHPPIHINPLLLPQVVTPSLGVLSVSRVTKPNVSNVCHFSSALIKVL